MGIAIRCSAFLFALNVRNDGVLRIAITVFTALGADASGILSRLIRPGNSMSLNSALKAESPISLSPYRQTFYGLDVTF